MLTPYRTETFNAQLKALRNNQAVVARIFRLIVRMPANILSLALGSLNRLNTARRDCGRAVSTKRTGLFTKL